MRTLFFLVLLVTSMVAQPTLPTGALGVVPSSNFTNAPSGYDWVFFMPDSATSVRGYFISNQGVILLDRNFSFPIAKVKGLKKISATRELAAANIVASRARTKRDVIISLNNFNLLHGGSASRIAMSAILEINSNAEFYKFRRSYVSNKHRVSFSVEPGYRGFDRWRAEVKDFHYGHFEDGGKKFIDDTKVYLRNIAEEEARLKKFLHPSSANTNTLENALQSSSKVDLSSAVNGIYEVQISTPTNSFYEFVWINIKPKVTPPSPKIGLQPRKRMGLPRSTPPKPVSSLWAGLGYEHTLHDAIIASFGVQWDLAPTIYLGLGAGYSFPKLRTDEKVYTIAPVGSFSGRSIVTENDQDLKEYSFRLNWGVGGEAFQGLVSFGKQFLTRKFVRDVREQIFRDEVLSQENNYREPVKEKKTTTDVYGVGGRLRIEKGIFMEIMATYADRQYGGLVSFSVKL